MAKRLMLVLVMVFLLPVGVFAAGNTLVIDNKTPEGEPLKGFVYEIVDKSGKRETIDLMQETTKKITLEDGEYTLEEVKRPEGYEAMKPVTLTLPHEGSNILRYQPKHIKAKIETPPKKYTNTGSVLPIGAGVGALVSLAGAFICYKGYRKEQTA